MIPITRIVCPPVLAHPTDRRLNSSLSTYGQLTPIQVFKHDQSFFLIDGFKRLSFLSDYQSDIWAIIHDSHSYPRHLLEAQFDKITQSLISKLRFFQWALMYDFDCLDELSIKSYSSIKIHIKSILRMPKPILDFCHQKQLSFKQCLNLSFYDSNLLLAVLKLNPSASLFVQLSQKISDLSKRLSVSPNELLQNAPTTPIELNHFLLGLSLPTLNAVNADLADLSTKLSHTLPVHWDRSLENKLLTLRLAIRSGDDLTAIISDLSRPLNQRVLTDMLSLL